MKILLIEWPEEGLKKLGGGFGHIYDLVKSGKICYIKHGKNIRFRPEDLDDYEKQNFVRRKYHGLIP